MNGKNIITAAIVGGVTLFAMAAVAATVWRACETYASPPVIVVGDMLSASPPSVGAAVRQPDDDVSDVMPRTVQGKRIHKHPDPTLSAHEPTASERIEVEVILENCHRAASVYGDPYSILYLIRMAEDEGMTGGMRLFLPAVWCHESSWSSKGDSIIGDGGNSIGPLQLQEKLASFCGTDARGDLIWSARCWIENVKRVTRKVGRVCGVADVETAEAWVSGGMRYAPRCSARSEHYDIFESWRLKSEKAKRDLAEEARQCLE